MGQKYHDEPSKTSGTLYHSVTTCVILNGVSKREKERERETERERERERDTSWVYPHTGIPKAHSSPKSASLISHLASINRFCGFKLR